MSQAVWQVLAANGFGGLTLRAVATRMGATTGLLTHYFPSKKALVRHAFDVAMEHGSSRKREKVAAEGLAGLRAALLDVMPMTPELVELNRVWVSFWDAALGDEELGEAECGRYERWRGMLRPHVISAVAKGELAADTDVEDIVVSAAAFAHGIVVQALFDPPRFPADRQVRLVDRFVEQLSR